MIDWQDDKVLQQRPRLKQTCVELHNIATQLGPSAKLPTMVDLRSQLGTSVQTLNDAIRELEKRNVLRSVHGVGIYVVEQDQKAVLTGNIGFMTTPTTQHVEDRIFWGKLFGGMRAEAGRRRRHLLVIDKSMPFEDWRKIDGMIVTDLKYPQDLTPKPPKGMPFVALINPQPGIVGVRADDFDGTYQLTRHLIGLGHRRIAYLTHSNPIVTLLQDRFRGYQAALKEAGIKFDPRLVRHELPVRTEPEPPDWALQCGEKSMTQWLNEDWRELGCTALMALNDDMALGVITALTQAGLRVPDDVSVTGFDGTLPQNSYTPQLTTIRVPLYEIGETAIRMMTDWLENPGQPPEAMTLPVELIEGYSSAPAQAGTH